MIHYPHMLSELKIFKNQKGFQNLNFSKELGKKILSLPISQDHTKKEILFIIKNIKNFFYKKN